MVLIARVGELARKLRVAIAGIGAERKRIFLREVGGEGRRRDGIEIGLAVRSASEGLVENVENLLLAGVQRFIALTFCSRPITTSFCEPTLGESLIP